MKRIVITFATIFLIQQAFGQDSEAQLIQNLFDLEKDQLVKYNMKLQSDQQSAFWSIYEVYEAKRKEQGKRRIELMKKYMSTYETISDEEASELATEMFNLQRDFVDLKEEYFLKVSKKLDSKIAGRFIQLEEYIHSKVKSQIFEDIRFIDASGRN